jgi:hypothetical protein
MLIKQIKVFQLPISLKEPFIISLGSLCFADNLIVKITKFYVIVYGLYGQIIVPEIRGHGAVTLGDFLKYLVQSTLNLA